MSATERRRENALALKFTRGSSCRRKRIGPKLLLSARNHHREWGAGQMQDAPVNSEESVAGSGCITLELHGNHAVFSALSYRYPLKILSPRMHEPAVAIAYILTYGGGLVSGDRIHLSVNVASGTSLMLLTQVIWIIYLHLLLISFVF